MALIAFEELNLTEQGLPKQDEQGNPLKIGTVTGRAFRTGMLALIKKASSMQLHINKMLLKGYPGVQNVKLEQNTLSFYYFPAYQCDQRSVQIEVTDEMYGLKVSNPTSD